MISHLRFSFQLRAAVSNCNTNFQYDSRMLESKGKGFSRNSALRELSFDLSVEHEKPRQRPSVRAPRPAPQH